MVFFTCNHCGESLKKPAVPKHYFGKCRFNEPFLTCVDCLKDYKGKEYEAHTKCVTETERYSAKGFVPKPSANKGEKKQELWSQWVQTVLDGDNLKADERNLITLLSKHENIPRKKSKFDNFVCNAYKAFSHNKNLLERVWVIMDGGFKKMNENTDKKDSEDKTEKGDSQDSTEKSKRKLESTDEKDKNRKKAKTETEDNAETSVTKTKKKKKNKEKDLESKSDGNQEEPTEKDNLCNDEASAPKEPKKKNKKKKKSKSDKVNEKQEESSTAKTEDKENHTQNGNVSGKKQKKKGKQSTEEQLTNGKIKGEESEEQKVNGSNDEPSSAETLGGFKWLDAILETLQKNGGNGMNLKKLEKKVLKKYCKVFNCEKTEKISKKFHRKIKKIDNVTLKKDLVVLTT